MKRATTVLVVLLATSGCSDVMPKITEPPIVRTDPTPTASLWTVVFNRNGECINGATLTVVRGQDSGTVVTQDSNCDLWDRAGGYTFDKLPPFVPITIRASATGYIDSAKTATPDLHNVADLVFALSPR